MYIHVLREDKPNGKTRSSSAVANHQAIPLRQKRRQFFYIPDTAASVSCCFLPTNSEMKSGSCNWTNFTEATILENKNSWSISFSFFLRESVELRVYHTHRYKTRLSFGYITHTDTRQEAIRLLIPGRDIGY